VAKENEHKHAHANQFRQPEWIRDFYSNPQGWTFDYLRGTDASNHV
jgi:hypothetical protein